MPDINASSKSESKDSATPEISVDEALVQEIQAKVYALNAALARASDRSIVVRIEMNTSQATSKPVDVVSFKVLDIWKQLKPISIIFTPR